MKTKFYYSIATNENDWDKEEQYCLECKNWAKFAEFCQNIADSMKTQVRGCSTEGYANQGTYFNPQKS